MNHVPVTRSTQNRLAFIIFEAATAATRSGESHLTKGHIAAAHGQYFLYFTMGRPFPLKIAFPVGDLDVHLKHASLGSAKSMTQMAPRSVQPFLQGSLV